MIGQELGWNFVERVVDRGFFEDQLVEHETTGLRAVRRLFSENFCADDIAVGTVRRQVEKAAVVQHPGIPAVLHVEDTGKQIAIYYEYIHGRAFEKMTRDRDFSKPKAWGGYSLAIVHLLLTLRQFGLGYDRLLLEDLVLLDGLIRVRNRWPIGDLDESETGGSPFLERMAQSPYGGVYAVEKRHPHAEALNRLKNLLYFMASGQWEQNMSQTIERHTAEKATGRSVSKTPLGLEYEIEDILMRLHDPAGERGIKSLEELENALTLLTGSSRASQSRASQSRASRSVSRSSQPDSISKTMGKPAPGSEWDSSGEIPMPEIPSPDEQEREYQRASAEAARIHNTEDALPKLGGPSDSDTGSRGLPQEATDDEDDDEDRSYLYPTRPSGDSTSRPMLSTSSLASAETTRRATKPARIKEPIEWGLWIKIFGALMVFGVIIVGAVFGVKYILLKKPNHAPVAQFQHTPGTLTVLQKIELDATHSSDTDGDSLTYTWRVVDLPKSDYLIRPNGSSESAQTTLQFFVSGEYTVELSVFDGALSSDPARQTLLIETAQPR
ncbi:PKD domain-containing protein [bacterium]|nr:PKD domain-containing protein [bacterium]